MKNLGTCDSPYEDLARTGPQICCDSVGNPGHKAVRSCIPCRIPCVKYLERGPTGQMITGLGKFNESWGGLYGI